MIMVFAMFIGMIWGIGYIIVALCGSEGGGMVAGIILVDIVLMAIFGAMGGAGIGIGIVVCAVLDVLIATSSHEKPSKRMTTKEQDKYDNDWGIISWDDKNR